MMKDGNLRGFIGGFDDVSNLFKKQKIRHSTLLLLINPIEIANNLMSIRTCRKNFEKVVVSPGFYLKENGAIN